MSGRSLQRLGRLGRRRIVLVAGGLALIFGALLWMRSLFLPRVQAQVPAGAPVTQAPPGQAPLPTDYASRAVAFLYGGNVMISRQELGEYLIARFGAAKLDLLVNKRIIEDACRPYIQEVTAGEIEMALQEDLKSLGVNLQTFITTFLRKAKKNLYEWKEDVLRPKLMLTKYCASQFHPTNEDIEKAYLAKYGEKFDGRLILWPPNELEKARAEYASLGSRPSAFEEVASRQSSISLRSSGGKIKPFGHGVMEPPVEEAAFRLQPGQISELINMDKLGWAVLKCERRLPASNVPLAKVINELMPEVKAKAVDKMMKDQFQIFRNNAKVYIVPGAVPELKDAADITPRPVPPPSQVVATYNDGRSVVTREELGEFLIERYGAEKLDLLVNKRIIDRACQARGIVISSAEVEKTFAADLKTFNLSVEQFRDRLLKQYRKSVYEWKEDVVRPKLQLAQLCRNRVHYSEEDIQHAFESLHGAKVECRVIIWPQDQLKFALQVYSTIRDSDKEFDNYAKHQLSTTLASNAGRIAPFGRYTTGNDNLEREAFNLQPGEVSSLLTTPQGHIVLKCVRQIPPESNVSLATERQKIIPLVLEKKIQDEMQVVVKELRNEAQPRLLIKDEARPADLEAENKNLMAETPEELKAPGDALKVPRLTQNLPPR
jgi:hypothetical protein